MVILLLCLIFKFDFVKDIYREEKTLAYQGLGSMHSFGHPLSVLECSPRRSGGTTIFQKCFLNVPRGDLYSVIS